MTTQKRLIAGMAIATQIDNHGNVLFEHQDLPNRMVWIEPRYCPPGLVKDNLLNIYYVYEPHDRGYYQAELP